MALRNSFSLTRPYRVVIYARMSTDRQNPRSPDQQIATIRELISRLKLPWTIVVIYRDDGISGRYQRKRPEFQKMMHDLRSGTVKADLVLVDTFERLSRGDDNAEIRRKLLRAGVLVLTADSNFQDPTSVPGRALAMVESIRATEEGRVKAHNVVRGKKDAVRMGHWAGGPVPFGFRLENVMVVRKGVEEVDHRILVPVAELSPIVVKAYQYAAQQKWGSTRICQALNQDPDVPDHLKPFVESTIDYMLDSELYYGEMVWGKNCTGVVDDVRVVQALPEEDWERNPNFCEAIVSRDLWDEAQAPRAERRRLRQVAVEQADEYEGIEGLRARGVALKYPLSGLVICHACGRSMIASSSAAYITVEGEERRYVAYACPAAASGACENTRRIPEEWLRETVMELIRQRLFLNPAS